MWGWFGGGCNVFLTFYTISNISRKKIWEYKANISHLMFSSWFFLYAGNIEKCPVTYSYWLNGRWFLQIVDIGNFIMRLEYWKVPLHLLVKWGRWFLQIVDIHVGNFNMKLTGRWFPQIVDMDSGNLYPIYIYNKNCSISLWTCSREISGDRVALFHFWSTFHVNWGK